MSYINFRVTGEEEGSMPLADVSATAAAEGGRSLTDGEELMAAAAIIDAVDSLENGQYLVIWRKIF